MRPKTNLSADIKKIKQEGKAYAKKSAKAFYKDDLPRELEFDRELAQISSKLAKRGIVHPLAKLGEIKIAAISKLEGKSKKSVAKTYGRSIINGFIKAGASQDLIISLTRHLDYTYSLTMLNELIFENREEYTLRIATLLAEIRNIKEKPTKQNKIRLKRILQELERLVGKERAIEMEKTDTETALAKKITENIINHKDIKGFKNQKPLAEE